MCATTPMLGLYMKILSSFMSLLWIQRFRNGLRILGKFVGPSQRLYALFIQNTLWINHAEFYGKCWLIAVLKTFKTFTFPYVFKCGAYVSAMRQIRLNIPIGINISIKIVGLMKGLKFWWVKSVIKYFMWLARSEYNGFVLSSVLYKPFSV